MDVSQALMCVHVTNILVVLGLIPSPILKMKSKRKAKGIIWEKLSMFSILLKSQCKYMRIMLCSAESLI